MLNAPMASRVSSSSRLLLKLMCDHHHTLQRIPNHPRFYFLFSRQDTMEPFYLYDLGIQIENKAIQRILCPMATELCHLILALEQEDGMRQTLPNIEENAEKLAKATDELASAARR